MKHIKTLNCTDRRNAFGTTSGFWVTSCKTSITLGTNMNQERNPNIAKFEK